VESGEGSWGDGVEGQQDRKSKGGLRSFFLDRAWIRGVDVSELKLDGGLRQESHRNWELSIGWEAEVM
jgi:hypothetical protein